MPGNVAQEDETEVLLLLQFSQVKKKKVNCSGGLIQGCMGRWGEVGKEDEEGGEEVSMLILKVTSGRKSVY